MNKPILIGIIILLSCFHISAQDQFASRVVKYSSQAGNKGYAAKQVLGIPNALDYGRNPVAWAPEAANLGTEYIEVGFARPMRIKQIAIWENFNPGAVFQIHLIDRSGKSHMVYEQQKPEKQIPRTRIFRYMMKMTPYEVSGVKLILNTAEVYGLNQIDAIGISSTTEPMQSIIRNPTDQAFLGKPENLGPQVNSADPDLLPFISVDGQTIYFARKNHANNIGDNKNDDIYTAHKEKNGKWSEAYNIGPPLNNSFNNFVCAVNPDGTEVLLSGRYAVNGLTKEGLHRTAYNNGIWSTPTPIIIENYKNSSPFVCYHISPDMKFLVIAMEHPDTYGDMDIYVSQRKSEGRYSTPKNLGSVINSAGTEPSVFLSADGKTIYFASDGHPGYGAYDMYMSRRLDNSWTKWSEPVNLGPGINTSDWDLYYTVPASGEYAYYSSEHNSIGRSDLYRVKLPKDVRPEPVAIVKPNFINLKTNAPIAKLEKENKAIVLQDDSKVNLYEEVKGYYPVNTSKDLSDVLEEEDDFGSGGKKKSENKVDEELESQMEDLLAKLQELKKEQASADNQFEEMSRTPEPVSGAATTKVNQPIIPGNDLDDKLAALRSDMDKVNDGKQPVNTYAADAGTRSYHVTPTATSQAYSSYEEDMPVYSPSSNGNIAPEEYLSYRDQIAELKLNKNKVASSPQPLTKYALQRTAIDEETSNELVASSLKTELEAVRNNQEEEEALDPEVEAYRQKLESLKEEEEPEGLPTGGKRITNSKETDTPVEVDPDVLAFQQKLEDMKKKMDKFPEATPDEDEADALETPVAIITEVSEPVNTKVRGRKSSRENKITEAPELIDDPVTLQENVPEKEIIAVEQPVTEVKVDPVVLKDQTEMELV
ncbi:MAG: hypothetical protein GY751_15425, partial [Bacteroidetes bacterium]|nr:hypothetical protein [Bacteroidota bacterium]